MSSPNFKTQIKNIRKEALELGYSSSTMDSYLNMWNNFILWKQEDNFTYNEEDYSNFLLGYYKFDVNTYTSKSKSRHQELMRSKRILDDFEAYKKSMTKKMFPKSKFSDYPKEWTEILNNFIYYSKEVRQNSESTVKIKKTYLERELSYFYHKGLKDLSSFSNIYINQYIIDTVNAGNISKRRNFHVLREFLKYLFIENITLEDLSIFVPIIHGKQRKKIPVYIKQDKVEELLDNIPKNKCNEKRDYAIILIAARLGLRISDILNIKLKNIDWTNNKLTIIQPKTNNLNILPLSKEVGWAIIEYVKVRPKCENEYLFVKLKYPFEKMAKFSNFNKYFDKIDLEINDENKKGIHNLRHSLAKNMLDSDIPLEIIASTLGHKDINTTANTYLKIDINHLKKCGLEVEE
jgi:site-specific recombinase XerD